MEGARPGTKMVGLRSTPMIIDLPKVQVDWSRSEQVNCDAFMRHFPRHTTKSRAATQRKAIRGASCMIAFVIRSLFTSLVLDGVMWSSTLARTSIGQ